MLDCSNCGELLIPIAVQSPTHQEITVDHCLSCGGSWFDRYEINRIRLSDVYKIAQATDIKRREAPWGKIERLCPRDFSQLQRFHTTITPENINMERCRICGGIFIMQKDLGKLKITQTSKMNTYAKTTLPFVSLSAVFIPIFFIGLLLFSTFLTVTNLRDAKEGETRAKELISGISAVSIDHSTEAILFLTQSEVATDLEYGTGILGRLTLTVSASPSRTHQVTLSDLIPNTTYRYRIIMMLPNGEKITSEEYTFTTTQ